MTRFNFSVGLPALVFFLLLAMAPAGAQQKQEREFRIRKAQFPESAREGNWRMRKSKSSR